MIKTNRMCIEFNKENIQRDFDIYVISKNSENLPLYKIFPPKVYDIAAYPKVGRLIDKSTIFNITIPIAINADKNKPNFICFFFENCVSKITLTILKYKILSINAANHSAIICTPIIFVSPKNEALLI